MGAFTFFEMFVFVVFIICLCKETIDSQVIEIVLVC